ncbi:Ig mu heavy chain disease protein [Columba guinea]|nr:Ig mu heavy chain disease protein [Columba guinea]
MEGDGRRWMEMDGEGSRMSKVGDGWRWKEMEGDGRRWMEMDGDGWRWMEMEGDGWRWMEMDGDGWRWKEMDGDGRRWKEMEGDGWRWMEMEGDGWRWKEMEGDGWRWKEMDGDGWRWKEMDGDGRRWKEMDGDGRRWMEMDGDGRRWKEMDGDGWRWKEMEGDGWRWMEMEGDGWRWMEMDGDGRRWMEMDGDGWRWKEMDGDGWRWMEMDGDGRRWKEMDGDGWRWKEMEGDGRRWKEMDGDGRRWMEMAGDGRRWMEMEGDGWRWIEMDGDGRRWMEMEGDGWRWKEMDGDGRRWMEMEGDGWRWLEMEGDGWRWKEMDGDGSRWMEMDRDGWRWKEMDGDGSRWMEMEGDGWRWIEMDGDGRRWMEKVLEGPRRSPTCSVPPGLTLPPGAPPEDDALDLEGLDVALGLFITLFLLSVTYGATVTFLKVGFGVPWVLLGAHGTLGVPRTCGVSSPSPCTLGCLVTNFIPTPVTVTWAPSTPPALTFAPLRDPNGRWTLASRVKVNGAGDSGRCTVHHPATGTTRTIEVKCGPTVTPKVPTVSLLHTCDVTSVQLVCEVTRFAPPPVAIDWLVDDHALTPSPPLDALESGADGTYRTGSRVNVTLEEWRQSIYTCRVTHPASGNVQEVTGHKCLGAPVDATSIRLFVLPPTPAELYVSQNPKLRCMVTSLPSDEGLVVSWTRQRGGTLQPNVPELKAQFNGTFTATSEVPVATRDWEAGDKFTCTVRHAELPAPISRSLTKRPVSSSQRTLTLTCLLRGFYPEDVSVEWQKNQETLDGGAYDVMPPRKEKGGAGEGSYFLYSRLGVPRDEWDRGTSYVCMVVHEGLPMKFIQRSIAKGPGKR